MLSQTRKEDDDEREYNILVQYSEVSQCR
jgi:hypothetical protein